MTTLTTPKVCPKCGFIAISIESMEQHFGYRTTGLGHKIMQSWCTPCRNNRPKEVDTLKGRDALKGFYRAHFPNDTCMTRAANFMLKKLNRKLGEGTVKYEP